MIFLMMAAHDTSTITTAAVAYFLAKNPEWQDRLRAESDRLGDDLSDIEDLEGLTAMDLVIKESLRLVAPVPLVMRKTVTDTLIDGYYVPPECSSSSRLRSTTLRPQCRPSRTGLTQRDSSRHGARIRPTASPGFRSEEARTSASGCTSAPWR